MLPTPLLLLACTATPGGHSDAEGAELLLEIEVTKGNDTPVRRVHWSTSEETTGAVQFGVGELAWQVMDDALGTEHDVLVAGMPAGEDWLLHAVSEGPSGRWASEVVSIPADYAPPELPVPALTVAPSSAVSGFLLTPVRGTTGAFLIAYDTEARPVWWSPEFSPRGFRGRYSPSRGEMAWLEGVSGGSEQFVVATLDGDTRTVPAPNSSHQDFVRLADGSFLVFVMDPRTLEGTEVQGESLQSVAEDGSTRTVWTSWDRWTWDGTGKVTDTGLLEWPHGNGLFVNAEETMAAVSLFFPGSIVEIRLADGYEEAVIGGSRSDWTISGDTFQSQHSPYLSADGNTLWLMDNGLASNQVPAEARAYALDRSTRTATASWVFDDGGAHTTVLLGDVIPRENGATLVNWGTAGVTQQLDAEGVIEWQFDFPLGTIPLLVEHLPDLGATPL